MQARFGYNDWVAEADLDTGFAGEIAVMHRVAERSGRRLVVRDWSHTDFMDNPTLYSRTAQVLCRDHDLIRAATVRHPIDNWIAMTKNGFLEISIPEYLSRYSAFLDMIETMPTMRYEQLCHTPDDAMKALCEGLDVRFDADYLERLPNIRWITGTNGRQSDALSVRPREPIAEDALGGVTPDSEHLRNIYAPMALVAIETLELSFGRPQVTTAVTRGAADVGSGVRAAA